MFLYDEVLGRIYFVVCDKLKLIVRVEANGVVFDDLLNNFFIEFIVVKKLFFVKDLMFFRCYRLGWGGVGRRGEESQDAGGGVGGG